MKPTRGHTFSQIGQKKAANGQTVAKLLENLDSCEVCAGGDTTSNLSWHINCSIHRPNVESLTGVPKMALIKTLAATAIAVSVAGSLYDIHLTGAREDAFRSPMKLYGRLSALASDLGAHGIDFKPTEQQKEVSSIFNNRLKTISEQFSKLINSEVDKLNNQLKKSQLKIELEKKIKM